MQDKDKGKAAPAATAYAHELTLSDGREVGIIHAKGKHSVEIGRAMGGDTARYQPATMHVVCRVAGSRLTIEEYEDLPLKDFNAIAAALLELGFIG